MSHRYLAVSSQLQSNCSICYSYDLIVGKLINLLLSVHQVAIIILLYYTRYVAARMFSWIIIILNLIDT